MNRSLDAEQKAEEIGDNEKEIANNVVEPVEQIKHVETMEVFTISSEPKTEPEADLESTGDMADDDGHTPDAILSAGKSSIGERTAIHNILLLSFIKVLSTFIYL